MPAEKNKECGQATAELMVSIIGIMIVFTGFLMIIDLGVGKVENVIEARGEADMNSYIGTYSGAAMSIRNWSAGNDGYFFTEDDEAVRPTFESVNTFSGQLRNDEFSLSSDFSLPYVQNNFAAEMPEGFLFLSAARLTSGSASKNITLDGATRALFFDTPSISLNDRIYMPQIE